MTDKKIDIAIVGATGVVGEAALDILENRNFPVNKLYPLASHDSVDQTVLFKNKNYNVLDLAEFDFSKVQIAIFSAGSEVSKKYAPIAAEKGCVVIDNTSCFRMDPDVPLVVPEVNPEEIKNYSNKNIISNPNCSTIQMLVALKPIYDLVGIENINISTYQSVSGAGRAAISELIAQTTDLLNGKAASNNVFSQQIAFNLIPQIDSFTENGYTKEELKLVNETRKIFNDYDLRINATAVRVPVIYGHSESIYIETSRPLSAKDAKKILSEAQSIKVLDDLSEELYPTPIEAAVSDDYVFVGRIRNEIDNPNGLNMWVVADNVRKGAALNAIQIAEMLVNYL